MTGPQIDEWKRAYDLLDCPYSASARDIKQAYRRITKRWHPDRYKSETPAHEEATQMMKQINEAHALVGEAPLRHFTGEHSGSSYPANYNWSAAAHPDDDALADFSPKFGRRIDFWTRFVFGAIFGLGAGFRGFARWWSPGHATLALLLYFGFVLLCALAAARWGDAFWTSGRS